MCNTSPNAHRTRARRIGAGVLAWVILAGLIAGCAPVFQTHGHVPSRSDLAQIVVGRDTRAQVRALLGPPATAGMRGDDTWYYVSTRMRHWAYRAPQPVARTLVAVRFDADGTVANIERFGLERGKVVVLSRRVTETTIRELGLIEQMLGNFGRVDIRRALEN